VWHKLKEEKERKTTMRNASQKKLRLIYQKLFAHYGEQQWWPAQTPFEVAVGAVLTQNTNWNNVEKAITNLKKAKMLSPEKIVSASDSALEEAIRPSGFFKQKAKTLRRVAEFFVGFDFDSKRAKRKGDSKEAREKEISDLRSSLQSIKGVGEETADSILLYALGLPVFVIDAYTIRFCERHGLVPKARRDKRDYELYRLFFESNLPRDAQHYNEFHALLVKLAKERCKKREKLCEGCPVKR